MKLFVEGNENSWECELMTIKYSLYSGEPSTLFLPKWGSSFHVRSDEYQLTDEDTYDPLADRFLVSAININDTSYLERSLDGSFLFPAPGNISSDQATILHGHDVINGHDDGSLILGVVTSVHNKIGLRYIWFLNDQAVVDGANMCVIKVKEPGTYFCKVMYKGSKLTSSVVNVSESQEVPRETPQKAASESSYNIEKEGKEITVQ